MLCDVESKCFAPTVAAGTSSSTSSSTSSRARAWVLTKHRGGRFLEDIVKGSGQVGVVPRPEGALRLQHSVASGHLDNK